MAVPREDWVNGQIPAASDLNTLARATHILAQDVDGGGAYKITNITQIDTNGWITCRGATGVAGPNQGRFDYTGGATRIVSCGPNASTNGLFQLVTYRSDGSGVLLPIQVNAAGGVGINAGATGRLTVGGLVNETAAVLRLDATYVGIGDYVAIGWGTPGGATAVSGIMARASAGGQMAFDFALQQNGTQTLATATKVMSLVGSVALNGAGYVGINNISPGECLDISGGALAVRGATSGAIASCSKVDFSSGSARLLAYGPNGSTNAGILLGSLRSDGTNILYALSANASGHINLGASQNAVAFTCPQSSTNIDATLVNSSCGFYLYEASNQVALRVKTSGGAVKQVVWTYT